MDGFRIERDSLGEVNVPDDALYGAQTQRAIENFPVSGIRFPREFIKALGLIKAVAAEANAELRLLDPERADAIKTAAEEVAEGMWDSQFPLDIFQTGSGTSINMNANEVIAGRASQILGAAKGERPLHPNDHVNMCQSSNDVIPTAIHLSAYLQIEEKLLPALRHLYITLLRRSEEFKEVVKTGRTHLMDAMPVLLGQEIDGWAYQVKTAVDRIDGSMKGLSRLAIGGTAVGTGINAHPDFGRLVALKLSERTGFIFKETENHFASQSSMDSITGLSGDLKTTASALMKIANDLRWMNSGPLAGLSEIRIPEVQPGSSIMPSKVNPVICEAVMMVSAQVAGNDLVITTANTHGNFQLNTMLPLIAYNILQSIIILANVVRLFADRVVAGFTVNEAVISELLEKNPVLITALTPVIGYDRAAMIAKTAHAEGRRIKDVVREMTDLSEEELDRLLDPARIARGGILKSW